MAAGTVRELLNRLRWDADAPAGEVEIGVLVRDEAGERVDRMSFAQVVDILSRGVTLPGGTFIPYHRFRTVSRGAETLWRAREKRGGDEG